jgi:translation initiation factor 3 subunit E
MPTDPTLLTKIAARLDKHLLLPVLRFAEEKSDSADHKKQFNAAIGQLLSQTSIMDDANTSVAAKQADLESNFAKALKSMGPLESLYFTNTEESGLRLKYAGKEFHEALRAGPVGSSELKTADVKQKNVKSLYDVAFTLVDSGNYSNAADALKVHNVITGVFTPAADEAKDQKKHQELQERNTSALWGQYLCDVLLGYSDASRTDLEALLADLDEWPADQANAARADLLHWSLFHYFKRRETSGLLDLIFAFDRNDRSKSYLYQNVIQCLAPHLLRYVAVAAVLNKKKKATLARAARLLDSESYLYQDKLTEFLVELCIKTNFARATALLADCEKELASDFFCADLRAEFIANARQMIFEDQLRVRQSLSISKTAELLGMTSDKTERWLVDLIREAKLDATVDSVNGVVRVSTASTSTQKAVWQYVMERLEHAAGGKA